MICKYWYLILLSFVLSVLTLKANMASPNVYGYIPSVDLHSKDVDIEHEDLTITLSDTATYAKYNVRYYINNYKDTGKLSLVFDAVQPYSEFEVFLNGSPIELAQVDATSNSLTTDSLQYKHENQVSFTLDISQGKHSIEVNYKGYPSEFLGDWVTQYTYSYNLEPARRWKTFKTLNLTIDATAFKDNIKDRISVNIQDSVYQLQGTSHTWQFDSIPQDMIDIRFLPKGDLPFMIYPEAIFLIVFILLFVLNLWWATRWRQFHLTKRYTLPAILGAFIVPALSIAAYMFSYPIIDWLIGKYASAFHGYIFLVVFTYPFFAVIYFIIIWIFDYLYKRKLRTKEKEFFNHEEIANTKKLIKNNIQEK